MSERATIGPYRIIARVGAGGMGEVFKAWDPRLERDVAVKLLHHEAAGDPERQKRLLAEGRAASALNHPNILRVYDADVDDDAYYLVSEWLEGKSLRDELTRGAVPLKRLLDLAVQIADGLAAAHAMGIVHRDIKPENIMLARDGTARIVDFGLARAEHRATATAETVAHSTTVSLEGGISGTPAYMSPEQARGTLGDFRTDQFSFGAMLYELATGRHAFRRDSVADTLAAVLHEDPRPITELNPRIPAPLRWIIEQCLAKDPGERYGATEDLARELRRVRDRLLEAIADWKVEIAPAAPRNRWTMVAATAAALIAILMIGVSLWQTTEPKPEFAPFVSASVYEGGPTWSPDGASVAYVADVSGVLQVFIKRLGDAASHQVTRMRFDAHRPIWAPSGQSLYFISQAGEQDALWSVSIAAGAPELVFQDVTRAAIDPRGTRLALMRGNPDALWWSTPPGASPVKEMRTPFDRLVTVGSQLSFSADGQLLIWMSSSGGRSENVAPLNSFFLFSADGSAPRLALTHVPNAVNLDSFTWLADQRHVVLALPDQRLGNRHLWLADTRSTFMSQITSTHTNETAPSSSPVGKRIAYATDEVDFDLVLLNSDDGTARPFLSTARNEFAPIWSLLGDQLAFITDRSGSLEIWTRSRDGQFERPVVRSTDFGSSRTESMGSVAFSPDGRTLAYQRSGDGAFEVWLSPVSGGAPVRLIDSPPGSDPYQDSPSWSPDNSWVAYTETNLNGIGQLLKKVRVGTSDIVQLTDKVAAYSQARWSPDGRWILCQKRDGLARVNATDGTSHVFATDAFLDFLWAPDSRRVYALADSDTAGHFALVEIDSVTEAVRVINPDLGSIPIANQPIRGFSFADGQGFLTSLARARSDIWLLEGVEPPRRGILDWLRR